MGPESVGKVSRIAACFWRDIRQIVLHLGSGMLFLRIEVRLARDHCTEMPVFIDSHLPHVLHS